MTIALAFAGLAVAGCSGQDEQAELRPLALREQTFTVVKSGTGYVVTWAGALSNTNRWHFGEHAVAVISAVDASGKEIAHAEQPLDAVPPGRTVAFSGQTTVKARPAKVKIDCRPATWKFAPRIPSAFIPFPVSDVVTEQLTAGQYLITGYVLDPFRKTARGIVVTALLRDKAGKLLGGGTSYVGDVHADRKGRFVITVDGVPGTVARTEIMARTWGTTAQPYVELALGGAMPVHTVTPTTEPFAKDRGYPVAIDRRE